LPRRLRTVVHCRGYVPLSNRKSKIPLFDAVSEHPNDSCVHVHPKGWGWHRQSQGGDSQYQVHKISHLGTDLTAHQHSLFADVLRPSSCVAFHALLVPPSVNDGRPKWITHVLSPVRGRLSLFHPRKAGLTVLSALPHAISLHHGRNRSCLAQLSTRSGLFRFEVLIRFCPALFESPSQTGTRVLHLSQAECFLPPRVISPLFVVSIYEIRRVKCFYGQDYRLRDWHFRCNYHAGEGSL
jgi:hypothetical protein